MERRNLIENILNLDFLRVDCLLPTCGLRHGDEFAGVRCLLSAVAVGDGEALVGVQACRVAGDPTPLLALLPWRAILSWRGEAEEEAAEGVEEEPRLVGVGVSSWGATLLAADEAAAPAAAAAAVLSLGSALMGSLDLGLPFGRAAPAPALVLLLAMLLWLRFSMRLFLATSAVVEVGVVDCGVAETAVVVALVVETVAVDFGGVVVEDADVVEAAAGGFAAAADADGVAGAAAEFLGRGGNGGGDGLGRGLLLLLLLLALLLLEAEEAGTTGGADL